MLKHKLTRDEHAALAEPLREHYKDVDGAFVLEGFAPVEQLNEFRTTNRRLTGELAGLKDKYGDLDPVAARAALEELGKRAKPPNDDELAQRIEAATKPLQTRLTAMETERNALRAKTERQTFDTTVNEAAQRAGVQADYLVDVRSRAQGAGFRVVGDTIRAMGGDTGDEPVLDKDGHELTLDGFLKTLPAAFYGRTQGSGPGRQTLAPGQTVKTGALYDPDPLAFGRHAEQIAKGDVQVIRP
jgi:hypothetical protein